MSKMNFLVAALAAVIAVAGLGGTASAATRCVNTAGSGGCYKTITLAVNAASAGDTINVAAGTYKEDVNIGKSLSLVGANPGSTIIDATNLANGIYIDGIDHVGLANVTVTGFTVQNAKYEGILITNATAILVWNNNVMANDKALNTGNSTCPGQPVFETSEADDCGEGIHLMGVSQATIGSNIVENNAGGILISDDTGVTHDVLIYVNTVNTNSYDCGITLASHPAASLTHSMTPLGVHHITVNGNTAVGNGGAGVGIFASVPGAAAYDNSIVNNTLLSNALPGVTMHSHTAGQTLSGNVITGNYISANAKDTDDAATSGPTGINLFGVSAATSNIITGNTIQNESIDISVNTPADVEIHLNNLLGSTSIGVQNLGVGTVSATQNYWGCATGANTGKCSTASGGVTYAPFYAASFNIP
jgi:hypothetical protein